MLDTIRQSPRSAAELEVADCVFWGLGFGVKGLGLRVHDTGLGLRLRVEGLASRRNDFRARADLGA